MSDSLLRKIRALLAKAASTDSEHEAAALSAKVRELMEEHQLSMSDVTQQDQHDPLGSSSVVLPYDEPCYQQLGFSLGFYMGGYATTQARWVEGRRRRVVSFWGREAARASCTEMLPYLIVACSRAARKMHRADPSVHGTPARAIRCVLFAMAGRLGRLTAQRPVPAPFPGALVPVPEAEAYALNNLERVTESKIVPTTTREAMEAAAAISLAGQVSDTVRDQTLRLS